MADVFISHASVDVERSREIATLLAGAGYSVWWDSQLRSGDRFQESIVGELNDSRAVVVLWSAASVRSDWVYSEARRANKQDKLVQLRVGHIDIDDLPAPFDAFHCPSADDVDAVLAGVAAVARELRTVKRRPAPERASPSHLPAARTPIIGRQSELADLRGCYERGERLVTLTGPGGSGKTKLAIEAARTCDQLFPAGVVFVGLVTATDAPTAWGMIGEALGLADELRGRGGVLAALGGDRRLLILDNLEQLEQAHEIVDEIVELTVGCAVLATSRRALHVVGEREFLVAPLSLPSGSDLDEMRTSGAVQMFVENGQRVRRDFALTQANAEAVSELCRRLDGLPLAIELVAARVRVQSPSALLQDLDVLLDVASAAPNRDQRQATVRGTISWSYDMLSPPQQAVLDCFGVFENGASLEALHAVVEDEDLAGHPLPELLYDLVDVNLVGAHETGDGRARFRVLETVRQFARRRLQERDSLLRRLQSHAQYYYDFTRELYGSAESRAHGLLRARLEEELANLRAMLSDGSVRVHDSEFYGEPVPPSHILALVVSTYIRFERVRDAFLLGFHAVEEGTADPYAEVAVRVVLGSSRQWPDATMLDENFVQTTAAKAKALKDAHLPEWVEPRNTEFYARRELIFLAHERGDLDSARTLCDDLMGIAETGTTLQKSLAHEALAFQADEDGDLERARIFLERMRLDLIALGHDRELGLWINNMASLEQELGQHAAAAKRLAKGAEQVIALGDPDILTNYLETFAEVVGERAPLLAAKAEGAASALRLATGLGLPAHLAARSQHLLAPVRASVAARAWQAAHESGRSSDPADVLRELSATAPGLF